MISEARLIALRKSTPGWTDGLHLNHSGASLMSSSSLKAIQDHFSLESSLGPMDAALAVKDRIQTLREQTAQLLNAESNEIAFQSSASSAFGAVWASLQPLRPGDRILVTRQEWGGNLETYQRSAARTGAQVEELPSLPDGRLDMEAVEKVLDEKVRWLSLTWLPANSGMIHDAIALGRLARSFEVPFFIDAGQALGQLPIDVRVLGCDVLKSTARKHLRGPRGTAILYVRREFLEQLDPPWVDVYSAPWAKNLRMDAGRFETSEQPIALLLGLLQAVDLALEIGVGSIAERVQGLAAQLRLRLSSTKGITIRDEANGPLSGLVSFTVEGMLAADVKLRLAEKKIRVGANGVPYTPLDMTARGLEGVVRASLSYLNELDDVERLATALESLVV